MEINDYELVSLAQEGNEDAVNLIYQKYRPLIIKKSKDAISRAPHHGIEISDIMQEGFIGLEEAIEKYNEKDNTLFYTFAVLCIDRQILNYLRKTIYGKGKILNEAISIDENIERLLTDNATTEEKIIKQEDENKIIKKLLKELTEFEKEVFKLKTKDYTFEEIAHTLNKDIKSIYNTHQRIKQKMKKIIATDNYN